MATREGGILAVMDRACKVFAETYVKYQIKIGPFASQSQQSNVELRHAREIVAELIHSAESFKVEAARIANAEAYKKAAERLEAALSAARGNA